MTVKLYEGCYGITRGGDILGPMAQGEAPIGRFIWGASDKTSARWATDGLDGNETSERSDGDIIAVYATRAEAEAALAKAEGKTLEAVWPKRNVKVLPGETPLNGDLGHPLLDVFKAGELARDNRTPSPYSGHSLEHCLHAAGWVQRDLRLALDAAQARLSEATPATAPAPDAARDERLFQAALAVLGGVAEVNPNLPGDPAAISGWPAPEVLAARRAKWAVLQADALLAALEARQ